MKYFVILVTFSGFIGNSKSFFGHYVNGNFHEDPVEEFTAELKTDLLNVVEEKWIEQRLNHFDMQDTRTWQMRYLENLEFFQVGGPIFVYVGGEWEIHKSRLLGGYLFDLAQEFNASLFYTEHRYYGKSHPTKNTSTKNLKYLTTDQALADLAHFITVTRKTIPGLENSKVFLMGGSYAGTVVTWFRLKYPHLADAAWASSAPLFATLDFGEFNEVMTESLQKVATPKCFNIFKSAFEQMDKLAESGDYSKLNKFFNTCQPLKAEDLKHFFYELTDHVASFIQVYNPTKMKAACNFLVHNNFPDPILAFALWFNGLSKNCFDASYASAVETHTQTSWNSTANKQMRQWIYQSCSQLGWFETTSSKNQIFTKLVPKDYFVKLCSDFYDGIFNQTIMERNFEATNIKYGGSNPEVSKVYFTYGDLDPWKAVGVSNYTAEKTPTNYIPLISHVGDFGPISKNDSIELTSSKQRIRHLLIDWLEL